MKNQLHPDVKWGWRVSTWIAMTFFILIFGGWLLIPALAVLIEYANISSQAIFAVIAGGFLFYVVFVVLITEVIVQMSYNRWFYEFTDSGLKLERGIIWKRYSNVPYERIQNVDVSRGIFARIFGYSAVMIQTAGYSAQAHSEGFIPAVDMNHAEEIREFVLKKITRKGRNQGI